MAVLFVPAALWGLNKAEERLNPLFTFWTYQGMLLGDVNHSIRNSANQNISSAKVDEDPTPYAAFGAVGRVGNFHVEIEGGTRIPIRMASIMITNTERVQSVTFAEESALSTYYTLGAKVSYRIREDAFHAAPGVGVMYRGRIWGAARSKSAFFPGGEKNNGGTGFHFEESIWLPEIFIEAFYRYDIWALSFRGGLYPYLHADIIEDHVLTTDHASNALSGVIGGRFTLTGSYYPAFLHGGSFFIEAGYEGYTADSQYRASGGALEFPTTGQTLNSLVKSSTMSNLFHIALGVRIVI
ncbi:MAG: hypothetical protein LBC77_03195 [Spirochaetaceae bacterium]|nr:hypothetical protein [Spirochaetaceae bacterium]